MHKHLCPIFAALVAITACSKHAAPEADAAPAAQVQVAAAKEQAIDRTVSAEAILYPMQQANIVPKISAPVARFLVQRGDHVRTGQLVAVLEHQDLSASALESKELYEQSRAAYANTANATLPEDLTKSKADVQSASEALDAARKAYENRQALFREGALAQKLVDDARVTLASAQSQFDTAQQHLKSLETVGRSEQLKGAQAQVAAAKAHYESSATQVAYAEVRSPITGVISDRPLNVGEMASSGSALLSVVDLSRVVARATIPVSQAAFIKRGNSAKISGPAGELTGKVTVVSPAVDPNTTTIQIWVEAPNTNEIFKPGTTVQVAVDAGQVNNAVVVPSSALLASDEGGERVMVAGADGLAHERPVKTGVRSGDAVQITDGVKPGEQVIVDGALGLDDKAKIQIGTKGEKASEDDAK